MFFRDSRTEDIVPVEELYRYCEIAREILVGEHGVGRVIARPFVGEAPNLRELQIAMIFLSCSPPKDTMLDVLQKEGYDTYGVGKIYDIFAGKGISHTTSSGNVDGMEKTIQLQDEDFHGLCFVNLVDFDMLYGHRNDIEGYAKAATVFDKQLGTFMEKMQARIF